jgi:hypothetical protein
MKNLKLTALAVLFSTGIFAQNFYITANAGYAFGMNSQLGWFSNNEQISIRDDVNGSFTSTNSAENVPFSLGKGMNFGASVGYMFNSHIGIDLGVNYLIGGKTESTSYYKNTDIYSNGTFVSESNSNESAYSRMWRILPSIVLTPGFEKFNPYAKVGIVMGFGSFYSESQSESNSTGPIGPSPYSNSSKTKYNGGMAFGFNGTIGSSYLLSEKLSVFGEVSFIGMSYAPTKSVLTERTINGIDDLPNLSTYDKEVEYVDELTYDSNPPDGDEPQQWLKTSFPMSSMGLNFGVMFSFK